MATARILVTGWSGFLGGFVVPALRARRLDVRTVAHHSGDAAVDLAAPGMIDAVREALAPDFVLHLAAMSRLADCERDPQRAAVVNTTVPEQWAERFGARLLFVSTDLVFDGTRGPYAEGAAVGPLSVYGCTKAEGEERVRRHGGRVVRLPLLFGADTAGRGASAMLRRALAAGRPLSLYTNEYRTPLHAADAARALAELILLEHAPDLLHLPGPERCSRWEFGRRFCAVHGLDAGLLQPVECSDAMRPRDVSLAGTWSAERSLAAMLEDG